MPKPRKVPKAQPSTSPLETSLINASLDGMALIDRQGRYVRVNEAHEKIHGYGPGELTGKPWQDLYSPSEKQRLQKEIEPALRRKGLWRGEAAGLRKDASSFPQEISLVEVSGGRRICVVRDITERKRAESEHRRMFALEKAARTEAEAASRAKDEFLAIVSHELRTPMTAILGWAWLLRSGDLKPEDLQRAIEIIERNMKLQAQIIEDLLDVSSIVTGRLHLDCRPVDVPQLIGEIWETVRPMAESKSVTLKQQFSSALSLEGDPYRLRQIFGHLLSNAVKFNRQGGIIEITARLKDSSISVSVSDSGQGISSDFLPYIFTPFRQSETSLTRQHRGLGIGLVLVRHLVELHGGSIQAASPGPEQGAVFTVRLPLAGRGERLASEPLSSLKAPAASFTDLSLEGLHLLVVEDELDTLEMLEELLKYCGARVFTADSAARAWPIIQKEKLDLLVCDIAMPGEDGLSFIKRVRALKGPVRNIPSLALTAYAKNSDRDAALKAGFNMYQAKPVEPAKLVACLKSLSERYCQKA